MKKTIIITVIVDDVEILELSELLEKVEDIFEDYKHKRTDVSLSDSPMIRPSLP